MYWKLAIHSHKLKAHAVRRCVCMWHDTMADGGGAGGGGGGSGGGVRNTYNVKTALPMQCAI